jgi:gamma-glutamyl-gamma-aminobutyraldehyde dehydrogenase
VFADAPNLDQAAKVSAAGIFRNAGQVCVAGSRLLVEKSIHAAFVDKLKAITEKMKVGDPLDLKTESGAVTSLDQLQKNLAHVEKAKVEGAIVQTGGNRILEESGGYYMAPTIMDNVRSGMTIAQQEVFGPVLSIIPFDDETDALRIANGTAYGLASAVWTSNLSRAHRMVRGINAGVVHVNTYGGADNTVPLGGHKQSGNGHDKSLHALDKYTNLKTAWIQL